MALEIFRAIARARKTFLYLGEDRRTLNYEDGVAALEWLALAFGFKEVVRTCGADGTLQPGEMLVGNARIMLATTPYHESPRRHQEHCSEAVA